MLRLRVIPIEVGLAVAAGLIRQKFLNPDRQV